MFICNQIKFYWRNVPVINKKSNQSEIDYLIVQILMTRTVCAYIYIYIYGWNPISRGVLGGARGVMIIVVGNGHGDTSSNPGRDWLHFTKH